MIQPQKVPLIGSIQMSIFSFTIYVYRFFSGIQANKKNTIHYLQVLSTLRNEEGKKKITKFVIRYIYEETKGENVASKRYNFSRLSMYD